MDTTHKSKRGIVNAVEGPESVQPGTHSMVNEKFKAWRIERKISEPSAFRPRRMKTMLLDQFLASPFMTNKPESFRKKAFNRLSKVMDGNGHPLNITQTDWELLVAKLAL